MQVCKARMKRVCGGGGLSKSHIGVIIAAALRRSWRGLVLLMAESCPGVQRAPPPWFMPEAIAHEPVLQHIVGVRNVLRHVQVRSVSNNLQLSVFIIAFQLNNPGWEQERIMNEDEQRKTNSVLLLDSWILLTSHTNKCLSWARLLFV